MFELGCIHYNWKEHEQAMEWITKAAEEAGLPKAMFKLGFILDEGEGLAPDYPAAAGWYRRAADAGHGGAAGALCNMYAVGRGGSDR